MGIFSWATGHWLDLLQSIGIVGGLLFTAITLQIDRRIRRVANLLTITQQHREIWKQVLEQPELQRVLARDVDLEASPVTRSEELFVLLLVLHLRSAREASKQGMFVAPEGLRKDIERFFSRPIPKTVWARIKPLQDIDFVEFVEAQRSSK